MMIREKLNFLSIFFLVIFFYIHITISECKSDFIELNNNYVEGIVKAKLDILAESTVYLDSDTFVKPRADGYFIFTNVKEGIYDIFVNHPYIEFNKFQVEVKKSITKNNDKIYIVRAYEYISPFEKNNLMVTQIVFEVNSIFEFLVPKKTFYLFNILKSPIFLIFLFSLILLSVLPKMQKLQEEVNEESTNTVTYKSGFIESVK
ncbi:ER membrane protein complex subunit 7, putative [Plasmodium yoelii]|nr:ER membrane protein complex subunit 7, putative [Plasmodium yoelii]CDU20461.1 conserved protein, unknown function [Plasmodium yoelii]VTZ81421.1 ER membrane protein complex subunit 7, putative [Plasmodium yoelii]|eukprot:XP_022812833.1 ER membrane protein complex subunit 7, putative [Plasmodium yoelii]